MMGHPLARWCSPAYLRRVAALWFLAGVVVGALVALAAGAFSCSTSEVLSHGNTESEKAVQAAGRALGEIARKR